MNICPTCVNLLQYRLPHMDRPAGLYCPTCPYVYPIEGEVKIEIEQDLVKKEKDLIYRKADLLKADCPQTDATCPMCSFGRAYFIQRQIRSADKPATVFHRCLRCDQIWHHG